MPGSLGCRPQADIARSTMVGGAGLTILWFEVFGGTVCDDPESCTMI
jgi:hypothetical protein